MLASRTRQGLLDLGYAFVSSTIGLQPSPTSRIYYAPDRAGEAQRLARDIAGSRELIAARPNVPVVRADIDYDVLIFLGDDWDEVTDLELIVPEQVDPPDFVPVASLD